MIRVNTLMQVLRLNTVNLLPSIDTNRSQFMAAIESYLTYVDHLVKHYGKTEAIRQLKILHIAAIRATTNDSLPIIPFCKTNKSGWPLCVKQLWPLLRSSCSDTKRLALTITRYYELMVLPPAFDPTPITGEGRALSADLLEEFNLFCKDWTQRLNIRNSTLPILDKVLGNLVKGPNGPSILTSHYDAKAVVADPVLHRNLVRLASLTGNRWITDFMENQASLTPAVTSIHSRISLLQQGGGKTRVIAIGDFWSQNILRSIHDKIMAVLRTLKTDGTWAQDLQANRIARESLGHKAHSFDLSNATDRFPVILQEILLSHVFGKKIASAWREVLTNRDFHINNTVVRWKVGQPLGMLSSWAVFALTHHALIEYLAWKEGIKSFRSYAVLGDDVVIWSEKVAMRYAHLLSQIDVSINWSKSLVSDDQNHRVEFAKRIFLNGTEVTGLKPSLLRQASKSIFMLVDLIQVARSRSWSLSWLEFQAPSYLNAKGKELLSILCWERDARETRASDPQAPLVRAHAVKGANALSAEISIQDLWSEMTKIRISLLIEKRDSVDKILCGLTPMEELFDREGIAYSKTQLGSWKPNDMHPVIWCINQVGEQLTLTLSALEYALQNEGGTIPPEISDVEYLPTPDTTVYFGDRQSLKSEFRSSIVLRSWFNLLKEI